MKRAITILSSIVAIIVVVLLVVLMTVDVNQYKGDIVRIVETNTGREFHIDGDIRLGVSLFPTVVIEKAGLGNTAWGSRDSMLDIERLELSISVLPLLTGDVQIKHVTLFRPTLYLETDTDGRGNWILEPGRETGQTAAADAPPSPDDGSAPAKLHFRHVLIQEAMITFRDGRSGEEQALAVDSLDIRADGRDSPMQLEFKAEYRDRPVRVSGTTGSLQDLLANRAFPVELEAGVGGLNLSMTGSAERPLEGSGLALQISLQADSLANLPFTDELPKTGPVSLQTTLTGGDGIYVIENLEARVGESDLSGRIGVDTTMQKPAVVVELHSRQIDLVPFEQEDEKDDEAKPERLFSDAPLPVDQFKSTDMTASLDIEKVLSSRLPMENVKVRLELRDGSLRIAPVTAGVVGGKLTAALGLAASGKDNMKLDFRFDIDGLQAGMLPQVSEKNYLDGGVTDVRIRANGTGNSVRSIMAGLDGGLLVKVGEGTVRNSALEMAGADLITKTWSMLRPENDEEKRTQLQCVVVNFDIKDGMAIADKGIALETRRMTVVGGGAVNLKTEELDLGIRPYPREGVGLSAGQLTELVRLRGTLANPETRPSTLAAMKTAATVGAAIATGGISLVAGALFTRATADSSPCLTALGEEQPRGEPEPAPDAGGGDKSSVGDKVKGMFKGLFGD